MDANKLEAIADNLLLFFPFFYKKLMKGSSQHSGKKPSVQQHPVLCLLMRRGPLHMSEIGNRLYISKPNMTPLIDKLIQEGKVERLVDKGDGRVVNIAITEKGKRFMKKERVLIKENIKRNISSLNEKDLNTLCASLEEIKKIFSKISEE